MCQVCQATSAYSLGKIKTNDARILQRDSKSSAISVNGRVQ